MPQPKRSRGEQR
uniref:Uncharacterized protein n=1 Tax=Anguilla anguilla TaxID=7936 RepID=A0A0E9V362_ANGAN